MNSNVQISTEEIEKMVLDTIYDCNATLHNNRHSRGEIYHRALDAKSTALLALVQLKNG